MSQVHKNWSRDETIIAFNLYCKIPFKEATKSSPLIVKYASILGRTPSALNMKIGNLASLDPELRKKGITGLVNRSKLDKEIWEEFNGNWNDLAFESEKISARLLGANIEDAEAEGLIRGDLVLPAGVDKQTVVKARVNQAFFRSMILAAYNYKCCITGLSAPQLLVASHIIPWAKNTETRTNPRNGLLLNSLHDRAFDTGLITVTNDYKVKISRHVYKLLPSDMIKEWLINYEGKKITLPEKFFPSAQSLRWHNNNVFKT